MPQHSMDDAVKEFLSERIASVAQLELLLLLRTSLPKRWTVGQLVDELRVETDWAGQQLEFFARVGLVTRDAQQPPTYCFEPSSPELERTVTQVAQEYLLHRVSLIEFIYSRPRDNLRAFADAFRLRKEPPRG